MSDENLATNEPGQQSEGQVSATPATASVRIRLPLSRPVVTYVLLALIVAVFVVEVVLEQLTGSPIIFYLGAQVNSWVAGGETWRLLSAVFLHAGLTHLAFNGWALYSLGRDSNPFTARAGSLPSTSFPAWRATSPGICSVTMDPLWGLRVRSSG